MLTAVMNRSMNGRITSRFVMEQSPFSKASEGIQSKVFINYTMKSRKRQIQMAQMAQIDIT